VNGDECEPIDQLLAENRRSRHLLARHGIAWQPQDITPTADRSPRLGTDEKVKRFASPVPRPGRRLPRPLPRCSLITGRMHSP